MRNGATIATILVRRPRGLVASGASVAAAVLVLASCAGPAGPEVQENDGVRTFVAAETDVSEHSGVDEEIGGLLTATADNCLAVESADRVLFVVVWPAGVELASDGAGVTVPHLGDIGIGDTFAAAGSYLPPPDDQALPEIPDECLDGAAEEVVVIDDVSTISR